MVAGVILCTSLYILFFRLLGTQNPYGFCSTMNLPLLVANQTSFHIHLRERTVNSFICLPAHTLTHSLIQLTSSGDLTFARHGSRAGDTEMNQASSPLLRSFWLAGWPGKRYTLTRAGGHAGRSHRGVGGSILKGGTLNPSCRRS